MCAMWNFAQFCGNLNPMLQWSDRFWPFRCFRSKTFQLSRIVGERFQIISWKSMPVSRTFQENLLNLCLCLITTSITRPIFSRISDQCLVSFLFKRWGVNLRKKTVVSIFIWFSQAFSESPERQTSFAIRFQLLFQFRICSFSLFLSGCFFNILTSIRNRCRIFPLMKRAINYVFV